MRGTDQKSGSLFSYVDLEDRIPSSHPLRKIRQIVNDALASLDGDFDRLYSAEGRPSIAPERLLRGSLIQILFSVRSERQLMEQMQYNLMFDRQSDDTEGRKAVHQQALGVEDARLDRADGHTFNVGDLQSGSPALPHRPQGSPKGPTRHEPGCAQSAPRAPPARTPSQTAAEAAAGPPARDGRSCS